mgnify:FL=1
MEDKGGDTEERDEDDEDDLIKETMSLNDLFAQINDLIFLVTRELIDLESLTESEMSRFWIAFQALINNSIF